MHDEQGKGSGSQGALPFFFSFLFYFCPLSRSTIAIYLSLYLSICIDRPVMPHHRVVVQTDKEAPWS